MKYLSVTYNLVLIVALIILGNSKLFGQDFRDNFSSASYAQNDGSLNFSGNWIETNDGGSGPTGGRILINTNQLRFQNMDNRQIERSLDLSSYSAATLTLDYNRTNGNESINIQIRNNAGTWVTRATTGGGAGSISYTLAANERHITSGIRLTTASGNWGGAETVFIDNVRFAVTVAGPTITIDDVIINEEDGTIVFTATHTGTTTAGSFTVDYAITNVSTNAADFSGATSGTISFIGTSVGSQTITINVVDDTDVEGLETFLVDLSNPSNGTVMLSDPQGDGTIIDNESFTMGNGSITTCSATFYDSGGPGGSYGNNELLTYTICPNTAGAMLSVNFTTFTVETGWDELEIFDSNTTTNSLGIFDQGNPPGIIVSTHASGCLTFVFDSDGSVVRDWAATIGCEGGDLVIDSPIVNETAGSMDFTITYTASTTSPFTIDYVTIENTAFEFSDFTSTSGTLSFSGVTNQSLTVTVPIIDNDYLEPDETLFLRLSNISDLSIAFSSTGTGTITDDADTAIPNEVPLTLFDEFNGYYDYAATAGSFRTTDNATDPCAIGPTSSNTLTSSIPVGSTIEKAYLTWAHSGALPDDVVTFEGQPVIAETIYSANQLAQYYSMKSDVTTIIQGLANPGTETYNITDLNITVAGYCGTVVLGGWSLMVFYTNPVLPAVSINFYDGFNTEQNSGSSYTLAGFFAIGSSGSKTSVLSWEGDVEFSGGETITLTTTSGTNTLNGDGDNTGGTQNVFNSTIYDDTTAPIINDSSQYGVDLDTYDISTLITQGETSATTNVNVGGDLVLLNSVLLKVPSNLMIGNIFEDLNYGGGLGRDQATSSGLPLRNVRVELYDSAGNLEDFDITDINGDYGIGGMASGNYDIRVVNNTIRSNRDAVPLCGSCIPVQTFRTSYAGGGAPFTQITDEVGGADPTAIDTPAGTVAVPQLIGAQSVTSVVILNEGVVGIDFGFTYNAIVNTNESGQGSLAQFITNANQLNNVTGLDIEANSIFDPAPGEKVSIFMIPPTGDALGRTADPNYNASGYFDITQSNGTDLPELFGDNIHVDGRTQTAYSGDTNPGTIGAGGTSVGTGGTMLPDYELPEIQIHQDDGHVIRSQSDGGVIRNLAVYADENSGIFSLGGNLTVTENLIGVNAEGNNAGNIDRGVFLRGTTNTNVDGNYIATNTETGIYIFQTTTTLIQNNHITNNGTSNCEDNIRVFDGSTVTIQNNLIENAAAVGIDTNGISGNITITGNTIRESGQTPGLCGAINENAGIILFGSNSTVSNNIINHNGGAGIVVAGFNTSGNLISQNSIYANGTAADALGIDLDNVAGSSDGNGVTLNDTGDGDNGANGNLNFPVFESASIRNGILKVVGWSRPGATLEFFLTDSNQGTAIAGDNQLGLSKDYGEGQTFLIAAVEGSISDVDTGTSSYSDADGNADTTNRFNFTIPITVAVPIAGNSITATATVANSTSEFANTFPLSIPYLITNRRITYRVTPQLVNFGTTGTLTPDITADNFQDGNSGAPFNIILRNTTGAAIASYEVLVKNVPYATIPSLTLGSHTLNTIDNGNGTYNHIFTSTAALAGATTRTISGGVPAPAGIGISCGCITFYKN